MMLGIDASQYDTCTTTNWGLAYQRGIRFTSIRAATTDNARKPVADKLHHTNMQRAGEAGLLRMPYAWLDPRVSGADQAKCYIESRDKGELPDMLDLENSGSITAWGMNVTQKIRNWLDIVETESGKTPIIYTSPSYIQSYLTKETWLSRYPLFIAHYNVAAPLIYLPWTPEWYGWQYTMVGDGTFYGFNVPGFQVKSVALAILRVA